MLKRVIARLPEDTMGKLRFCVGKFAVKKMYGPCERMLSQEQAIAIAIEMLYEQLVAESIDEQHLKGVVFDVIEHFNTANSKKKKEVKTTDVHS